MYYLTYEQSIINYLLLYAGVIYYLSSIAHATGLKAKLHQCHTGYVHAHKLQTLNCPSSASNFD
jgi:hypothetical protein